jgi:glycosyltransferase involved in cell wall biosynthesis
MVRSPTISVIVPARNEGERVAHTVESIVDASSHPPDIEIVVVDDASSPADRPIVPDVVRGVPVRVVRSRRHLGVGGARNLGAREARGDVLFITDAHVTVSDGWDREIVRLMSPGRILAATIRDSNSTWRGYGCRLVVPHMGTHWNVERPDGEVAVQVASSAGTVLERSLFNDIGGYDEGMLVYGGYEPEFSLRAWLAGAEIVTAPGIEVSHRFKPPGERVHFSGKVRTYLVHNCLRFGVVYLPEVMILEMVRLHGLEFPSHIRNALQLLEQRGAWERRQEMARTLRYDFAWFVRRFNLTDQVGDPIPIRELVEA